MKNILLLTICILFIAALSSCAKKGNSTIHSKGFSVNPFMEKSTLATAD